MKDLIQSLIYIQQHLIVPKDQFNSFGKYNYRSCESILEALKPLLNANQMTIMLSDDVKEIGGRVYVQATATLTDAETGESVSVTAFAREEESKKGMDGSQVTGASSSYARKYALCGLLAIDDNKDSDSTNTHGEEEKPQIPLFRCEKCGEVLSPYTANGKTVSIRSHAERSNERFGRVLCINCINKIKEVNNA